MFWALFQGDIDLVAEKLKDPSLQGALVSAYVQTLDGRMLYEQNSGTRVMPGSNEKILSVSFALAKLGPDFRSRTRFWREKGKVVIDAPGNPMLTYEQMQAARKVVGKSSVVQVRQAYRVGVPAGWELDDLPNRYAAPVTALTMEQGAFELWGGHGRLYFMPESFGATARFMGGGTNRVDYNPFTKVAKVYGSVPREATRLDTLAIADPDQAVARFFGGYLAATKTVPARKPDYEAVSAPLQEVATTCLVKSDNNIAEHLMLLAAAAEGPLGDKPYDTAATRMKKFLVDEVGCDPADLRPQDGSGMSRHNLVTTRALARVMSWATNKWGEKWTGALASPGKGTLADRLADTGFRGKTGTLDSACALTGVLSSADGQKLVISLVFNHYTATNAQVRGVQDEIVRILEKAQIGTVFEGSDFREVAFPIASVSVVHGYRNDRFDHDRRFARPGKDRGVEPDHAGSHRAQRVALRLR